MQPARSAACNNHQNYCDLYRMDVAIACTTGSVFALRIIQTRKRGFLFFTKKKVCGLRKRCNQCVEILGEQTQPDNGNGHPDQNASLQDCYIRSFHVSNRDQTNSWKRPLKAVAGNGPRHCISYRVIM
jgi:hypothetical protein